MKEDRPVVTTGTACGGRESRLAITTDSMDKVGVFLRQERERLGLTELDITARIGVARKTVKDIEANKNQMRLSTLVTIAEALGLEIEIRRKE